MSTPHDRQRTAAFRKWLAHVGQLADAQRITGIAPRTLQRFYSGQQPPPTRLLETLAAQVRDAGDNPALADTLAAASRQPERDHA